MKKLAINGGPKVINKEFEKLNTIDDKEIKSVTKVLKSGNLSNFVGDWEPDFFGGDKVQKFEKNWSNYFGVKHSIAVNSWTSGLICAVGSLDIEPQDEVILPSWTMAATASSILVWNAIPVFSDIDPKTFTLDPKKIESKITKKTKAIITADIHGMSSDIDEIMKIAKKYKLKVISDTAQAIGSIYKGKKSGTISHIGGFSLNRFKHIHTGEGGVIVTNNDILADRMRMIRNHADAVAGRRKIKKINNLVGFNFRMGEIEAAIGIEQLKKLNSIIKSRQKAAKILTNGIKNLDGLTTPFIPKDQTHVFYTYPIIIDEKKINVTSTMLKKALVAEGVSIGNSYIDVHLYPTYQKKIAFGSKGYPWISDNYTSKVNYSKGTCETAEAYNKSSYLTMEFCNYKYFDKDILQVVRAFQKVWANLGELQI